MVLLCNRMVVQKKFRDGFLTAKNPNLSIFYLFGVLLAFCFDVLDQFVCIELWGRHFGWANKFTFRNSGDPITFGQYF